MLLGLNRNVEGVVNNHPDDPMCLVLNTATLMGWARRTVHRPMRVAIRAGTRTGADRSRSHEVGPYRRDPMMLRPNVGRRDIRTQ